jgi:transcriptional regulator with XRE-family HTH domain
MLFSYPEVLLMTLGSYVRAKRKEKGFTLRQLAEQVGVDFTYLSKLENDRLEYSPSIKMLKQLAAALDIDELEVLERANKVSPLLQELFGEPRALRFLRRARELKADPSVWDRLLEYLEQRSEGKR